MSQTFRSFVVTFLYSFIVNLVKFDRSSGQTTEQFQSDIIKTINFAFPDHLT